MTSANPPQGAIVGQVGPNARYVASNVPIGDYRVPTQGASPRYATSDVTDHAFTDSPIGAWSPALRLDPHGIPDAGRNQAIPLRDYRPDPRQAPELWWDGARGPGREVNDRHSSQETVDADGRPLYRGLADILRKRAAPDIRRTPPAETRITQQMSPSAYSFTRPFDQELERNFNGQHFSMADHRRNYQIYGMAPVGTRRNTFRQDPAPWDTDIVDSVPAFDPVNARRIVPVDVPDSATRSWRL